MHARERPVDAAEEKTSPWLFLAGSRIKGEILIFAWLYIKCKIGARLGLHQVVLRTPMVLNSMRELSACVGGISGVP